MACAVQIGLGKNETHDPRCGDGHRRNWNHRRERVQSLAQTAVAWSPTGRWAIERPDQACERCIECIWNEKEDARMKND